MGPISSFEDMSLDGWQLSDSSTNGTADEQIMVLPILIKNKETERIYHCDPFKSVLEQYRFFCLIGTGIKYYFQNITSILLRYLLIVQVSCSEFKSYLFLC